MGSVNGNPVAFVYSFQLKKEKNITRVRAMFNAVRRSASKLEKGI